MLDRNFAEHFAADWMNSWNQRDLERILSHYTEDFEMSSPLIAQIAGEPSGKLKGKDRVGDYWAKGLAAFPNLHFELVSILTGAESITLYYKNHRGQFVAEVFHFNADGKVEKSFAHYTA